ncbi:NUDIX hydrolase [Candidatus Chlorohelix sp.]|uniref:NUDIX hydrolase n=1 Tax=Candidatus Chlorohelix sp. TaxID=3139201 RepID=UPI00302CD644
MSVGRAEEMETLERNAPRESEQIFKGRKFSVRVDHLTKADGRRYSREIVAHDGAVVIIPVDADGKIILVRQWRRPTDKILIELPAGTLELPEEPAYCADRELQEEIGYKAGKLTGMGGFYSAPGFCSEYLWLFLAEELVESQLEPDENEAIDIIRVTLDEALQMIEDGVICDAKSVAGLLRYYYRLNKK